MAFRGITLRGVSQLWGRIQELCAGGLFERDVVINGQSFLGTRDPLKLTTTQLVYG